MTEEGILLRICRSIQVEGAFGLLKNDFGFRISIKNRILPHPALRKQDNAS